MSGAGILFGASLFCFLVAFAAGGFALSGPKLGDFRAQCLQKTKTAFSSFRNARSSAARLSRARRFSRRKESLLLGELAPQLKSDSVPCVVQAAQKLGDAKDLSAVPVLCAALETSVNAQRPGWRDASAALADALAQIGDARALPLLYKLENVRGIGFIPNIRSAIARIEPHANLLRPGTQSDTDREQSLLRPLPNRDSIEPPAQLLRPTRQD